MNARLWHRNLTLLNAISFSRTFMIIMPVFVPLMAKYGLSMKETMMLQSIFAAVTLVLELPSGYIADVFGRKQSLLFGYFMAGIGFSQIVVADTFIELAVFEVTLGIAMSFISGSDTALAFESEKALGLSGGQPAIARLISWMNFGEGAASFTAFVVLRYGYDYLLWIQAIVGWVPFLLGLLLVDTNRQGHEAHTKISIRDIGTAYMSNPIVPWMTLLFVVTMSFTYLVAWLNQSLWLQYDLPVEYFGLAWGLLGLTVGLTARFGARLPDYFGKATLLSITSLLLIFGALAITVKSLAVVFVGALFISAFRGIAAPKIKVLVNNGVDNNYRATVNSIVGASFRVSTLVLGPIMGFIVDLRGGHFAAVCILVIAIPAVIGLLMTNRKLRPTRFAFKSQTSD